MSGITFWALVVSLFVHQWLLAITSQNDQWSPQGQKAATYLAGVIAGINRLHREFGIDLAKYGPSMWTEFTAAFDWIDAVVAAHKAGTE